MLVRESEIPDALHILLSEETRLVNFLRNTNHLFPNAVAVNNTAFFLTRAEQWISLAGIQRQLTRRLEDITGSLNYYLQESLDALYLGASISPVLIRSLISTALSLDNISRAHSLAALPDSAWGLPAPEHSDRTIVETRAILALFRGEDVFTHRLLETLQGLTFEINSSESVTHELKRAVLVYPILTSLLNKDAVSFGQSLLSFVESFRLVRNYPYRSISTILAALGFCRLAHLRSMDVNVSHPDLYLAIPGAVRDGLPVD